MSAAVKAERRLLRRQQAAQAARERKKIDAHLASTGDAPDRSNRPELFESKSGRPASAVPASTRPPEGAGGRILRSRSEYERWLDTPKNLSAAVAFSIGLVRLRNPESTVTGWVEAADAPALLEEGWSRA